MRKLLSTSALAVAAALASAHAGAELFSLTDAAGSLSNGASGNQYTVTVNGITLTAHAYVSQVSTPLDARAASSWQSAVTHVNANGIGAGPNNNSQQPNFSIDNNGALEVVVFEATRAMNWNAFQLGFATNGDQPKQPLPFDRSHP